MVKGSTEYEIAVDKIFSEGGTLWFVERTDTNEFLSLSLPSILGGPRLGINWMPEINEFCLCYAYLTKEDAESMDYSFSEGGCSSCGHGSEKIPIIVTEHEFIPEPQPKTKCIVCLTETDNEIWCDIHTPLV